MRSPSAPRDPRPLLALLVWLGIWPSATLLALLLRPLNQAWPLPLQTLSTTALLVPWMVYGVMPVVHHVLVRISPKPAHSLSA